MFFLIILLWLFIIFIENLGIGEFILIKWLLLFVVVWVNLWEKIMFDEVLDIFYVGWMVLVGSL